MTHKRDIIFFDGVCTLCNKSIRFIHRFDLNNRFYFSSIQGETAQKYLTETEISNLSSVIYIDKDLNKYYKSTAALKILVRLNPFFYLFYVLFLIPLFIRDTIYDCISNSRYKIFGKSEYCSFNFELKKHLIP